MNTKGAFDESGFGCKPHMRGRTTLSLYGMTEPPAEPLLNNLARALVEMFEEGVENLSDLIANISQRT